MSKLEATKFVAYVTVILISLHPPYLSLLITSIHGRLYQPRKEEGPVMAHCVLMQG